MNFAVILLAPILLISFWAFISFSPKVGNRQGVLVFNLCVLVVGSLLCALLTLKIYSSMAAGTDRAWWPILSLLGTLVVFPVVLLAGRLVRNGLVFRPPNNHG